MDKWPRLSTMLKDGTSAYGINLSAKSPDTGTRDTKDTKIRESDTDTVTPGIRTRRTRFIYIYILKFKNIDI